MDLQIHTLVNTCKNNKQYNKNKTKKTKKTKKLKTTDSLRLLEDWHWQAELRQTMESYIDKVPSDSYETLSNDLEFYEHYSFKVMNSELIEINEIFQLNWTLDSIYYPWNRTFEIGYFAH